MRPALKVDPEGLTLNAQEVSKQSISCDRVQLALTLLMEFPL